MSPDRDGDATATRPWRGVEAEALHAVASDLGESDMRALLRRAVAHGEARHQAAMELVLVAAKALIAEARGPSRAIREMQALADAIERGEVDP